MVDPESELFGLDLKISTVNSFLSFIGLLDVLQDGVVFVWSIYDTFFETGDSHTGVLWVTTTILFFDIFQVYMSSITTPLGVRSAKIEKRVLTAINSFDVLYDLGLIGLHLAIGIFQSNDELLLLTIVIGTVILASDMLSLYYMIFDFEKDHKGPLYSYE